MQVSTRCFRAGVWAALVMVAGCEDDPASSPYTIADSSGIAIVTTHELEWDTLRSWAPPPLTRIPGERDLTSTLALVSDAKILTSGQIAVLEAQQQQILLYDSQGHPVASVGQRGQGPGEFQAAVALSRVDSGGFAVYDQVLGRETTFDEAGSVVRVVSYSTPPFPRPPMRMWRLGHGSVLAWDYNLRDVETVGSAGGADRILVRGYLRTVNSALESDTLLITTALEMIREQGRFWFPPFGPRASITVDDDGQIILSTGARHEVLWISPSQGTQRISRFVSGDVRLSTTTLERLRDSARTATASLGEPFLSEPIYDPELQPDTRPSFRRIVVDASGNIWAKRFLYGNEESHWWIISPAGVFRGLVELPERSDILDFAGGVMVVRRLDENDVPSLEVWPIPNQVLYLR